MREIKFRGCAVEELVGSQWITNSYGVTKIEYTDETSSVHLLTPYGDYHVAEESVGQYTGLKDMYGKEIYEGDIVEHCNETRWEVVFNSGSFKRVSIEHPISNLYLLGESDLENIKIIGNIYENSKLAE